MLSHFGKLEVRNKKKTLDDRIFSGLLVGFGMIMGKIIYWCKVTCLWTLIYVKTDFWVIVL